MQADPQTPCVIGFYDEDTDSEVTNCFFNSSSESAFVCLPVRRRLIRASLFRCVPQWQKRMTISRVTGVNGPHCDPLRGCHACSVGEHGQNSPVNPFQRHNVCICLQELKPIPPSTHFVSFSPRHLAETDPFSAIQCTSTRPQHIMLSRTKNGRSRSLLQYTLELVSLSSPARHRDLKT